MAHRKALPKRLGRPPLGASIDTRKRITETARVLFAERGFQVTTNQMIAAEAGITTGALYHYFESKYSIYAAVFDDVQAVVYDRFEAVEIPNQTFVSRFEAMLDVAYDLNTEDPSLARLIGAARVDEQRDPDLRAVLRPVHEQRRGGFFGRLVELGVKTGEIDPSHRSLVQALLQIVLIGLTDAVSGNPVEHRVAIDGIKALFEGKLLRATN